MSHAIMKMLYNSGEVRTAIRGLFSNGKGRRVVVVGFVGKGAEAYLPKRNGIELYCWPKGGGTSSDALRRLAKDNVNIRFVDGLHAKVYWSEGRGCVITSANLSTNALGAGDLKEAGVLLGPNACDIDRLLSELHPRPMAESELRRLDRENSLLVSQQPQLRALVRQRQSFAEWAASRFRKQWKLGWWDEEDDFSKTARKFVKAEYGLSRPDYFIPGRKGDYKDGDWILCFNSATPRISEIRWLFADDVIMIRGSNRTYPYEALQVWPSDNRRCPPPPFEIDKRFRKAFRKAISEYGKKKIKELKTAKLPPRVLGDMEKEYAVQSAG